jgi:hypothetical protein
MKVDEMSQSENLNSQSGQREFAVEREHLLERLSIQQIERREIVTDPLGAVPQLPFGHLNATWLRFLKSLTDNAEIWSFSALWRKRWGGEELRCGYVAVSQGLPGNYLLTMRKEFLYEVLSHIDAAQAHLYEVPAFLRKPSV